MRNDFCFNPPHFPVVQGLAEGLSIDKENYSNGGERQSHNLPESNAKTFYLPGRKLITQTNKQTLRERSHSSSDISSGKIRKRKMERRRHPIHAYNVSKETLGLITLP